MLPKIQILVGKVEQSRRHHSGESVLLAKIENISLALIISNDGKCTIHRTEDAKMRPHISGEVIYLL